MGVNAITTKTGSNGETKDAIQINICDVTDTCCSTTLDRSGRTDFKKGAVNVFDRPEEMGDCHDVYLDKDELTVTLSKSGTDGWFVDWVDVTLPYKVNFHCVFGIWLDDERTDSRPSGLKSDPVQCQRSQTGVLNAKQNDWIIKTSC